MLWKAYFDKGLGLTNIFSKLIPLLALYELIKLDDFTITGVFIIVYAVVCFLIGWWWYSNEWVLAEAEVGNQFNLFQREMREKFK